MRKFHEDEGGQLILLACVSIVIAIVLIATYEYTTLWAGETSINHETSDSFFFYRSARDRYEKIYNNTDYLNLSKSPNITVFEREMKTFAILHGYSMDFVRNDTHARIIFIDKDLRIDEIFVKK